MTFIECLNDVFATFAGTAVMIVAIKLIFFPFIKIRRRQRRRKLEELEIEFRKENERRSQTPFCKKC